LAHTAVVVVACVPGGSIVTNGTLRRSVRPASDAGLARLASSIAPAGNVSGMPCAWMAMRLMARGELTLPSAP